MNHFWRYSTIRTQPLARLLIIFFLAGRFFGLPKLAERTLMSGLSLISTQLARRLYETLGSFCLC